MDMMAYPGLDRLLISYHPHASLTTVHMLHFAASIVLK